MKDCFPPLCQWLLPSSVSCRHSSSTWSISITTDKPQWRNTVCHSHAAQSNQCLQFIFSVRNNFSLLWDQLSGAKVAVKKLKYPFCCPWSIYLLFCSEMHLKKRHLTAFHSGGFFFYCHFLFEMKLYFNLHMYVFVQMKSIVIFQN